jgi:pimeloyl-ACP methyl ester carboxylesterase
MKKKLAIFPILFLVTACSSPVVSKLDGHMSTPIREVATVVVDENGVPENLEWDRYVNSFKKIDFQKGCEPRKFTPPEGVKAKGKILLVHGFTACPQQFFEWSEILSKRGIVVYLFTLPGHGIKKHKDGKDNFLALPKHNKYDEYEKLTEVMNKVAMADDLPSTVGGLSVGGAVAMHAALRAANPYEKLILISPFFKMPRFLQRHLAGPIAGNLPLLKNKQVGWGAGCHEELRRGRVGICDFTISQVYTAQVYGKHVISVADQLSPLTQSQVLGVEKDTGADNGAIKQIAHTLSFAKDAQVSSCFYPKGANHSLFSRFDRPDENKFWLATLLEDASNFVEHGTKVPAQKKSMYEKEFSVCDVR